MILHSNFSCSQSQLYIPCKIKIYFCNHFPLVIFRQETTGTRGPESRSPDHWSFECVQSFCAKALFFPQDTLNKTYSTSFRKKMHLQKKIMYGNQGYTNRFMGSKAPGWNILVSRQSVPCSLSLVRRSLTRWIDRESAIVDAFFPKVSTPPSQKKKAPPITGQVPNTRAPPTAGSNRPNKRVPTILACGRFGPTSLFWSFYKGGTSFSRNSAKKRMASALKSSSDAIPGLVSAENLYPRPHNHSQCSVENGPSK